jgi:lipoate---protein ligase
MWMDNWVLNLPKNVWPSPVLWRFFVPSFSYVVLSSSNKPELETKENFLRSKGIRVLRRKGGGGTVLLSPGCVVLTLAFYAKDVFSNGVYFRAINNLWMDSLKNAGLVLPQGQELATRGISDIAAGQQKIAGTSVFRRKHLLVYQGSLLVNPDWELLDATLAHPSREPDYRGGRSHREFLTSTQELGLPLPPHALCKQCDLYFQSNATAGLSEHFL